MTILGCGKDKASSSGSSSGDDVDPIVGTFELPGLENMITFHADGRVEDDSAKKREAKCKAAGFPLKEALTWRREDGHYVLFGNALSSTSSYGKVDSCETTAKQIIMILSGDELKFTNDGETRTLVRKSSRTRTYGGSYGEQIIGSFRIPGKGGSITFKADGSVEMPNKEEQRIQRCEDAGFPVKPWQKWRKEGDHYLLVGENLIITETDGELVGCRTKSQQLKLTPKGRDLEASVDGQTIVLERD